MKGKLSLIDGGFNNKGVMEGIFEYNKNNLVNHKLPILHEETSLLNFFIYFIQNRT